MNRCSVSAITFLAFSIIHSAAMDPSTTTLEVWCVAKNNANDSSLQAALDWACGPGGTDCSTLHSTIGTCNTDLFDSASFVFNYYFLTHNLTTYSCNFGGAAAITSLNPSHGSCIFPSSFSVNNHKSREQSMAGREWRGDVDGSASMIVGRLRLTMGFMVVMVMNFIPTWT